MVGPTDPSTAAYLDAKMADSMAVDLAVEMGSELALLMDGLKVVWMVASTVVEMDTQMVDYLDFE